MLVGCPYAGYTASKSPLPIMSGNVLLDISGEKNYEDMGVFRQRVWFPADEPAGKGKTYAVSRDPMAKESTGRIKDG